MSVQLTSSEDSPPASRWRLWVDGCGGYLLLTGSQWSVGGVDPRSPAEICVRTDWPRRAGMIHRKGGDYFWQHANDDTHQLINPKQPLPIGGSAAMTLTCPSPLCNSAVLSIRPPHRFADHIDEVMLVDQTLLMGAGKDRHIVTREFTDEAVLVHRQGSWMGKLNSQGEFEEITPGIRITLGSLAMTLEKA